MKMREIAENGMKSWQKSNEEKHFNKRKARFFQKIIICWCLEEFLSLDNKDQRIGMVRSSVVGEEVERGAILKTPSFESQDYFEAIWGRSFSWCVTYQMCVSIQHPEQQLLEDVFEHFHGFWIAKERLGKILVN